MNLIIDILAFVLTFFVMEFVAWFMHKYVMHGFLWFLHKDHHTGAKGVFQKNDWFILIFAIPSMTSYILGAFLGITTLIWIGSGILLYGITYFLVHESFIHQRFKFIGKNSDLFYFKAIRKAHKMHHSHIGKEDGESFGMLIVGKKYYDMVKTENKK